MESMRITAETVEATLEDTGLFISVYCRHDVVVAVTSSNIVRMRVRWVAGLPVVDSTVPVRLGWTRFTAPVTCLDPDTAIIVEWLTVQARHIVADARMRFNGSILADVLDQTAWESNVERTMGPDGINRIECADGTILSLLPASDGDVVLLTDGRMHHIEYGHHGLIDQDRLASGLKTIIADHEKRSRRRCVRNA
ncbi:hypothetical protein [Bifidobacterium felsineum]|uniref:hypothetical protein n=1 Tax=Bifidobacterium felsineum TaxID=2045440 RepID=UPI001BDD8EDB|nr:hypothetical protein [Bifidobacterium felsineum]MBT1164641.1 hypothetical protein [Bifidobacterium felsineum]